MKDAYGRERTTSYWLNQVGIGWRAILHPLLAYLNSIGVSVFDVKEKFGILRVYTESVSEVDQEIIDSAEILSTIICECCGAPGELRMDLPWRKTLCPKCLDKARKRT